MVYVRVKLIIIHGEKFAIEDDVDDDALLAERYPDVMRLVMWSNEDCMLLI